MNNEELKLNALAYLVVNSNPANELLKEKQDMLVDEFTKALSPEEDNTEQKIKESLTPKEASTQ